jgi:hypothetical protein
MPQMFEAVYIVLRFSLSLLTLSLEDSHELCNFQSHHPDR